jgi:hypothetical protein
MGQGSGKNGMVERGLEMKKEYDLDRRRLGVNMTAVGKNGVV